MDREELLDWLLAGDPAVRWQALRDLAEAPAAEVEAARALVAEEGWGARLLAAQDPDGRWAGSLYSPKWTSTTYTLLLLHWLGLPPGHPRAVAGCRLLWDGATWHAGGLTLARSLPYPEACITAMLVLVASSLGGRDAPYDEPCDAAVSWLVDQQLPDGGWNCRTPRTGSQHGSFHTSISVLDALLAYAGSGGPVPVEAALARGRGFFLDHRLLCSHRTGEVVDPAFTRFPFPPQWHFDVLRGLEHFRAAGAAPDDRLAAGIEVLTKARRPDGTWPGHRPHPGRQWFRLEEPGPSRLATLRCLRVLDWWSAGSASR